MSNMTIEKYQRSMGHLATGCPIKDRPPSREHLATIEDACARLITLTIGMTEEEVNKYLTIIKEACARLITLTSGMTEEEINKYTTIADILRQHFEQIVLHMEADQV